MWSPCRRLARLARDTAQKPTWHELESSQIVN
jgi:hypothetical protein